MYSRAFIRAHDKTTHRGDIQARYNGVTVGDEKTNICFEGDPVECPSCRTIGVTKCVAPYRPWTGHDGRQVNLDGDLCICKCSPPPRLKASSNSMIMSFETHEIGAMPGAEAWLQYSGIKSYEYDLHFLVQDSESRRPLAHVRYKITLEDGKKYLGITDANGLTEKVFGDSPQKAKIEVPYYDSDTSHPNPCGESDACRC